MSAPGFAGWLAEAMIASTLLMLVVLAVRRVVRRTFGPQVAYALWLLPLVRLILPPLPAAWRPAVAAPIQAAGDTLVLIVRPATRVVEAAPAAASPSLGAWLAAGWLIGAAAFLLYHVASHWLFCRRIRAGAASTDRIGGVRIVVSDAAPGPVAFGVWRRYVALPGDVAERYDADERALALAHELSHHRRGDLIANWAALAMLALHWFDPLAWYAFRAFRADQELANDACVLAGRPRTDRHVYATAILKTAQGGAMSPICHLHTIDDLKGRLKMLATSPASRRRLATGGATVAALLIGSLALTASGSSAAAIGKQVEQAVAPVPPVPAVPPVIADPAAAPQHHRITRVIVTRDGKTTVHDDMTSADIDAGIARGERIAIEPAVPGGNRMIVKMPDDPTSLVEVQSIPAISSARCGIGSGTPASMVIDTGRGEKRKIVICTDRIRRVTADAMVTMGNGKDIERDAYAHALAGLLDARTKAVADVGMSDADRTRALAAIDQSIAEMRGQLARFN